MRKTILAFVSLLLVLSTASLADVVSVQPASLTTAVGQTFTLNIFISETSDLYAYQVDVGFNPTVLRAVSVTEGPFLATGGSTIFLPGIIDNAGGAITYNGGMLTGALPGVSGAGSLLDVTFLALAPGSSNVQLYNVLAIDSFGMGRTVTTAGATVSVSDTVVPEPGTLVLLSGVVFALVFYRRRCG